MSLTDSYDKFARLNPSEKIWILLRPVLASTIERNARKALATAAKLFRSAESIHNGPGDAFRHCYWSALLTRDMGFLNTKGYTDAHEDFDGNPPDEKEMDLHNNLQGMVIGIEHGRKATDDVLVKACLKALKDGKLKTIR